MAHLNEIDTFRAVWHTEATIADHATFDHPHQYATGMVFVNGVQVLANGEHTGATPGRIVRRPGWKASS